MVRKTFGIYSEINMPLQLTVELGKEHLCCWQKEPRSEKIYSFELFQFEKNKDENFAEIFRSIKNQSRILTREYIDTKIVWENSNAVIIPKEFQSTENEKAFLALAAGNAFHSKPCSLPAGEMSVVYYVDEEWESILQQQFSQYEGVHKYCTIVNEWLDKKSEVHADYIWVLLYQNHFVLTAFTKDRLLLVNSFVYQTPEDVLYHILNVCERLQLNKNEIHFSFAGLIDVESNLFKTLASYLNNIFFIVPSAEILAAEDFQQYPSHYFSSFLNIFP